jgi:hypothetical protein
MEIIRVSGTNMEQLGNRGDLIDESLKGSQFTATIETDSGRKSVELVQMVTRPLLTLVQNKSTSLLLFSLVRQS